MAEPGAGRGKGGGILIFDDNPHIQILLRIFFQKRGHEVHISSDGTEAVALARQHEPALIVMDIIMPGKDGIEACADLRREGVRTPIIMLTSKDYEEDRQRSLQAGANAYLIKPFSPKELDAVIQPLLRAT